MFRPPALRAIALVVSGVYVLGAAGAAAAETRVEHILQSSSSSKRQETRLVDTGQTEEVRGARQLLGTAPIVEQKALSATSKLVTESEIRGYRVPVRTHPLKREEKREVTTTTTNYIRRTTTKVVEKEWPVWVYYRSDTINSEPSNTEPSLFADDRNPPITPAMIPGWFQEFTQEELSSKKTTFVQIVKDSIHLYLAFDMNLKFVTGYFRDHGSHGRSAIARAEVIRYADHDAIKLHAECNIRGRLPPFNDCGTNISETFHLNGYVVKQETKTQTRTDIKEEPYTSVSETPTAWTATGRTELGLALRSPGLRYDPEKEKVILRQYVALNDAVAAKDLARSGNDLRKTFSADASSGKSQASLSGSKVRQTLGANQVKPSLVAGSKGAGAPDKSGGAPGLPSLPSLPPAVKESPKPANPHAAAPAAGSVGSTPKPGPAPGSDLWLLELLKNAPQPTPTPTSGRGKPGSGTVNGRKG